MNRLMQINAWTLASLAKARREHLLAALKLRRYLRGGLCPYWEVAPYRAELRRHRSAARLYNVKAAIANATN